MKYKESETPNFDNEVRDLKMKYAGMARQIAQGRGEDQSIMDDLMQNMNLPFINRVMRFPLPGSLKSHTSTYMTRMEIRQRFELTLSSMILSTRFHAELSL
jgi:hypothetical protein